MDKGIPYIQDNVVHHEKNFNVGLPGQALAGWPTRGLDVGAIEYIHKRLIEERDNGKAVLVVSFELDEILNVSDRIAVIHDGKIQGIVSPETTNKQELGVLMAGGNLGKEKSDV
ncbi:ABC transporter ATP-binding protein [Streptococcus pneumoniae]|nr:ABC transporter ATP-binding protein [Streptococcus pneumoniae]